MDTYSWEAERKKKEEGEDERILRYWIYNDGVHEWDYISQQKEKKCRTGTKAEKR